MLPVRRAAAAICALRPGRLPDRDRPATPSAPAVGLRVGSAGAARRRPHRRCGGRRVITPTCSRSASTSTSIQREAVEAQSQPTPCKRMIASLIGRTLMIGVDRLDYSKGLVERFQAYERLPRDASREPRPRHVPADRAAVARRRARLRRDPPARSSRRPAASTAASPTRTGRRSATSTATSRTTC